MRHYTTVEVDLGDDGRGWHYASLGRRGGHPVGACAEHPPHPTAAEARACYQQWLRGRVTLDGGPTSWVNCQHAAGTPDRCPKPANRYAQCGPYQIASLCDGHLTLEHALTALGLDSAEAGDRWES